MNSPLELVLLLLLGCGHLPLVVSFVRELHRSRIPATWSFAAMGIVLYYDLGVVCQFLEIEYLSGFFPSLRDCSEDELVMLVLLLLASPYLIWGGAQVLARRRADWNEDRLLSIPAPMRGLFAVLFLPLSITLAAFGVYALWGARSIAEIKLQWVSFFGSAYIVFMIPMFLVAFLVRTDFARERWGRMLLFFLICCSVLATLFLGQRTMTLLPILILLLFYFRLRLARLAAATALLVVVSASTLFFYKGYAVSSDLELQDGLLQVLNNDITRATVLVQALRESDLIGTRILPYSGQGYVYTLALYVPRSILPEKGYSTTAYFTGMAIGEDVEYLNWGLGVGFLEQIALNFGKLALLPGVLICGMLLGLLDRLSISAPGTLVGIRLGAVWMSGYDASSIVMYFGSMVLFSILLGSVFTAARRTEPQPMEPRRILEAPDFISQPDSLAAER